MRGARPMSWGNRSASVPDSRLARGSGCLVAPCRTLLCAAVLGTCGPLSARLFAADAATPASAPPTEDSIAAAKRELEQFKRATSTGALDSRSGAMPSISIPQVHTDDEPVLITPPADQLKPKGKPSANWLVDAMMNPKRDGENGIDRARTDRRTTRDGDLPLRHKTQGVHLTDAEKAGDSDKLADTGKSADPEQPAPAKPDVVFNPLSQFMTSWMTPQDYTLLKPNLDHSAIATAGPDTQPQAGVASADPDGLAALAGISGETFAAPKPGYAPPTGADNPFLSAMSLPDALPPTAITQATAATAPSPPPPLLDPTPPPEQPDRSTVPDFAKPAEDDKYYKPLKRF